MAILIPEGKIEGWDFFYEDEEERAVHDFGWVAWLALSTEFL